MKYRIIYKFPKVTSKFLFFATRPCITVHSWRRNKTDKNIINQCGRIACKIRLRNAKNSLFIIQKVSLKPFCVFCISRISNSARETRTFSQLRFEEMISLRNFSEHLFKNDSHVWIYYQLQLGCDLVHMSVQISRSKWNLTKKLDGVRGFADIRLSCVWSEFEFLLCSCSMNAQNIISLAQIHVSNYILGITRTVRRNRNLLRH